MRTTKTLLSVSALSAALTAMTAFAEYDGNGGVDDGSPITAAELSKKGYRFPNELKADATHTEAARHAWRLFIAANQPTTATLKSGAGRATPDTDRSFKDTGGSAPQANPTVWESFYHRAEAFPFYSSKPPANPADRVPTYYFYEEVDGDKEPHTVTGAHYVNLDENNQVGQNMLYYNGATDPDFPVLYMAKVNQVELGYVWDRGRASASKSLSFPHPVVDGPKSETVSTIEVKSAWRRVSDIQPADTRDRYHRVKATYYKEADGESKPVEDEFALIALHIIQKTNNYQTFIFSTFEHVDSVTTNDDGEITDPNIDLSYKTLKYGDDSPTKTNAYGAYSANKAGQSGQKNVKTDYTLPKAGDAPADRFPVERLKTISAEVNDVNNAVAALIPSDSVWKNYRLKGVQAVPSSYPEDNGTVALDYYLANIVVESSQPGLQLFTGTVENPDSSNNYTFTNHRALPGSGSEGPNVSQGPTDGKPVGTAKWTMGGCMGCHGNAQQAGQDMSFLGFGLGGAGFEAETVATEAMSDAERLKHYKTIMSRKAKAVQAD